MSKRGKVVKANVPAAPIAAAETTMVDVAAGSEPSAEPRPTAASEGIEAEPPSWLGRVLAVAVGLWLVAWALPIGGARGGGMGWLGLGGASGGEYPAVHTVATWLALAATGVVGAAKLRPTWLLTAALLAQTALHLRLDAEPGLYQGMAEPLRSSLYGLQPAAFLALLGAGMAAGLTGARGTHWRWVAGLGALGLWLHDWLPVGWIGAIRLPVFSALVGVPAPFREAGPPQTLALPHGTWLVLQGVASMGLLAVLSLQRQIHKQTWLGLLALATVATLGHVAGSGLGLTAVVLAGTAFAAACLLVAIHQSKDLTVWRLSWEPAAVVGIIALYLLLKTAGIGYSTTDEALYYYAGKVWSEGKWPYRDFFFSHPPLHIAAPALVYKRVWLFVCGRQVVVGL
jgi:hypothetical protein